ncbi:EAL domain-containing protein [Vibrio campbellii]|uniref:EAL domain-containing protein n=1 Tax=Vibrio campbellii TaxID=680 RepID=UPI00215C1B47|nr:EAL domain-containing protein [Vibrio campbellii]MCR9907632.1 EAL domain-containing protein [Vibrio campbellii]
MDKFDIEGIYFISEISKFNTPIVWIITCSKHPEISRVINELCYSSGANKVLHRGNELSLGELVDLLSQTKLHLSKPVAIKLGGIDLPSKVNGDVISRAKFINFYQPQYNIATNEIVSLEVLSRCLDSELGTIPPCHFIKLVDINELFWDVLKRALCDSLLIPLNVKLSINISQRTLQEPICKRLLSMCSVYNFEPSRLTLELTEDEVFDEGVVSLANIIAIRAAGIGLAIDDFGTGHSSLSQLVALPFNELKMDRVFVKDIKRDVKSQEVLRMSLLLARSLDMTLVVEGIEDQDTLTYIQGAGARYYQGFLAGQPMPIEQLVNTMSWGRLSS